MATEADVRAKEAYARARAAKEKVEGIEVLAHTLFWSCFHFNIRVVIHVVVLVTCRRASYT